MNSFTYTFIIPHHNSPGFLNRCLDSIPARDDIQIIVVDDNSSQDAKPCVKRSDVEIIYIDAADTKGAGRARNTGLKKAKGKWVLFPDCDDYYSENFIALLDRYKDSEIDVLYFNYTFIDGTSGRKIDDSKRQKILSQNHFSSEDIEYIRYRNNPPWTKMISREYIERHKMYFEEVKNGNDILFSIFVASYSSNIAINGERIYNYIRTPNSIGTKKQSEEDVLCRIEHRIKKLSLFYNIGHPEWKIDVFRYMVANMKGRDWHCRMRLLLSTLRMICSNKLRKEWVHIIEDHKVPNQA